MKKIARGLCPPLLWNVGSRIRHGADPVKPEQNELTMWMGYTIPGWLDPGNLALFAYCIEHLPSGAPLIEIGSFAGLSLNHLIDLLRRSGRSNKVFSVDEWIFDDDYRPDLLIEGLCR
jgi:hypothetical protein